MTYVTLELPVEEAQSLPLSELMPQPSGPIPGNESIFTVNLTFEEWSRIEPLLIGERIPHKLRQSGRSNWQARFGASW